MTQILSTVFQSMNIAVLDRVDGQTFQLLTQPPSWLDQFLQKELVIGDNIQFKDMLPFLECFLCEAEEFWESKVNTPYRSGPWVDFTPNGEEIPLEAIALWQNNKSLLVLQDLGEEYYNEVVRLQRYRDNALSQEMFQLEIESQTKQLRIREEEITMKLLSATGYRDRETVTQVRRIGLYAEIMAKALDWDEAKTADIRIAAPMYDIGKIGVPDKILLKPEKLTEAETQEMQQHATIGSDILSGTNIPLLQMASEIAMHHHEKWDGTGYPTGLSGKDIPESARITTIVDVYDTLIHKEKSSESAALTMMKQMAGKHFDPDLFEVFIENLSIMREVINANADPDITN